MERLELRILIIEDNPGDQSQILNYIRLTSLAMSQIFRADTLGKGIQVLCKTEIDIVLMDLDLPDSFGFDTIKKLREAVPNIPVIIITAQDIRKTVLDTFKHGAQDYLIKGHFEECNLENSILYNIESMKHEQLLKKKQVALNASELKNAALLKAIPDNIFRFSGDGLILDYHLSVQNLKMRDRHKKSVLEFVSKELGTLHLKKIKEALESSEMVIYEIKKKVLRKMNYFEVRMIKSGNYEVVAIIRNITFEKEQKQELIHAFLEGEQKERRRIAQELHDGLGQILTAAIMQLSLAHKKMHDPSLVIPVISLLERSVKEYRSISHNLLPPAIDQVSILVALEDLCSKLCNAFTTKITFSSKVKSDPFTKQQATEVYRICQELLSNACKHAHATEISLYVYKKSCKSMICVTDNGIGFDNTSLVRDQTKGIGLTNIKRRIKLLDGEIDFFSLPGKRTSITLSIPLL